MDLCAGRGHEQNARPATSGTALIGGAAESRPPRGLPAGTQRRRAPARAAALRAALPFSRHGAGRRRAAALRLGVRHDAAARSAAAADRRRRVTVASTDPVSILVVDDTLTNIK